MAYTEQQSTHTYNVHEHTIHFERNEEGRVFSSKMAHAGIFPSSIFFQQRFAKSLRTVHYENLFLTHSLFEADLHRRILQGIELAHSLTQVS